MRQNEIMEENLKRRWHKKRGIKERKLESTKRGKKNRKTLRLEGKKKQYLKKYARKE
jgi:hypothetical protein